MADDEASEDGAPASDPVFEEAVVWHARLREPARDPAAADRVRASFHAWVSAHPSHRAAFGEAERLWGALGEPARLALAASPDGRSGGPRRTRVLGRLAVAACLLLAACLGAAWQETVVDRILSDHWTAIGETRSVRLPDGTTVTLGTDSAITIGRDGNRRTVRLIRGEGWFDVASDLSRPFVVEAGGGQVRVTGTRFGVRMAGDDAVVSLAEGRVLLTAGGATGAARAPTALQPGQRARLTSTGVTPPQPFDPSATTAWLRGRIVFYDAPLSEVVAELNRYRPGRIVIARASLGSLRVSGAFSAASTDRALSAIAESLPVEVVRLTDFLVLLR